MRPADGVAHETSSLRHVAELAGVSVATASRVMSGSSHPVSPATRARVLSAADQLAFEPNRLARALVTSRSHTIGVIVHDIADPYFGEIVKGLEASDRVVTSVDREGLADGAAVVPPP